MPVLKLVTPTICPSKNIVVYMTAILLTSKNFTFVDIILGAHSGAVDSDIILQAGRTWA